MGASRKNTSVLEGVRVPIRFDEDGTKIITCDKCGKNLRNLGTVDTFYSSFDMFICEDCNIGYKASILTGMASDFYILVEPTSIDDIRTIIDNRIKLEKYKIKTREELAAKGKRGRKPNASK